MYLICIVMPNREKTYLKTIFPMIVVASYRGLEGTFSILFEDTNRSLGCPPEFVVDYFVFFKKSEF